MPKIPIHVVHFHRRPHKGYFSVERLFASIRDHLPAHVQCDVAMSRFESHGLFRRLYNIVEAVFRQGEVNHVTGDVHFLTYLVTKKRTVLTVLDCVLLNRLRGWRKKMVLLLWYRLPIKRSSCITVISEGVKQELLSHVTCDPARIHVVHVPVLPEFQATPKEFNPQKPTVLHIGTGKNKNLLRVANALKNVSCHLRIVGKLSLEQEKALKHNAIEYSAVSGISDEQIVSEYEKCDMLVFASTYEGFGMPIVEANAVGRPVVTSRIAPMPEVAGTAAMLVDPFDEESIRNGILEIITNKPYRDELVEQGLKNAKRFHPSIIAAQYTELYEEVLKTGSQDK